jgi:hypothetical protein
MAHFSYKKRRDFVKMGKGMAETLRLYNFLTF